MRQTSKSFGGNIAIPADASPRDVFAATAAMVTDAIDKNESFRSRGEPGLDLKTLRFYYVGPGDIQPHNVVGWVAERE